MSLIQIYIKNSSITEIDTETEYEFFLDCCIGYGSYGYVFRSFIDNLAIKILTDEYGGIEKDYTDFHEYDVINKLIDNHHKFKVNCNQYAIGDLVANECEYKYEENVNIMVNKKDCPMKLVSIIRKNDKAKRFTITEGYKAIIMPIFTPFFNIVKDNTFIKRDTYICKLMDALIKSSEEFISIGLINLDLKTNNAVFDENNDFRFIDFGMVRSYDKMNEYFNNDVKYYIWPLKNIPLNFYLPYMISIFILEIFYSKIHNCKNIPDVIGFVIDRFNQLITVSTDIKNLLKKSVIDFMEWDEFKKEFDKIKQRYQLENVINDLTVFQ